ncbi:hypothetical protein AALA83_09300 [Oscillospiraceae bacterium 44-5]
MQELIRLYGEKMELPDPPHCYMLRCLTETSAWIKSLDNKEQGMVFEYIRYLLKRPGDSTLKAKTSMLLKQFPDWERYLKEAYL